MVKLRLNLADTYFDMFFLFYEKQTNAPHCIVYKFHIITTPGYNNARIEILCRKDQGKCENCEKKIVKVIHVMNL